MTLALTCIAQKVQELSSGKVAVCLELYQKSSSKVSQVYAALSRVTSLHSPYAISSPNPNNVKEERSALEQYDHPGKESNIFCQKSAKQT